VYAWEIPYHRADPFASVDGAVEQNGGLAALTTAPPDVDSTESSSLDRGTNVDNLGLGGEAALEVGKELRVVREGVVGGKPRLRGD